MDNFVKKVIKAYFGGCFATGLFILSLINFSGIMLIATTSMGDIKFFQASGGLMFIVWIFTFSIHKIVFVINLIKNYSSQ